jgi:hypothetical protein
VGTFGQTLFYAGLCIELLLVWRCLSQGHWRRYPYFFSYLAVVVLRTAALPLAELRWGYSSPEYGLFYWSTNLVPKVAWACVVWEIFRSAFLANPRLREVTGGLLAIAITVLAGLFWLQGLPTTHWITDVERRSGLVVSVLVLLALALVRYYELNLGRNIWGIAVGAGVYASVAIVNFALVDIWGWSYLRIWQHARPVSYLVVLCVWLWALWGFHPNPAGPAPPEAAAELEGAWRRVWTRLKLQWRRVWRKGLTGGAGVNRAP